ncbi:unnamed protein product, partial [Mesorhabditis belari]|uniref:Uncharacterized protein n=1 Tax=Mesorhabditis belari TaxID=2138241 RepID=A0AAF3J3P2_9BILA
MSLSPLNFPSLPRELQGFVVKWLHDAEAQRFFRGNKYTKTLIEKRGIFPGYIAEIKIRIGQSSDNDFAVFVDVYPRHFRGDSSDKQQWLLNFNQFDSLAKSKTLWTALTRIPVYRCLSIDADEEELGAVDLDSFVEFLTFYRPACPLFAQIRRLHIDGEPEVIKVLLPHLHLSSIEKISVRLPFARIDTLVFQTYWTEILSRSHRDCPYVLVILLDEQTPWTMIDIESNARHFEFNCDLLELLETALNEILQKGIPSRDPNVTAQIRNYLSEADCGEMKCVHEKLLNLIVKNPGTKQVEIGALSASELAQFHYLHRQSSFKYYAKTLVSNAGVRVWLNERDTAEARVHYFIQTRDQREIVIVLFVDQKLDAPDPAVDVNVVWIPRF